jgi:predicted DNA-binding protein (MmcQ/YjbR family)
VSHIERPCLNRRASKVFMLMTEVPGRPVVILKSDPSDAEALRTAYADITPGYHMNKKHWITLSPGNSIGTKLVEDLVTDSYRLVVDTLPRSRRPVVPEKSRRHAQSPRGPHRTQCGVRSSTCWTSTRWPVECS